MKNITFLCHLKGMVQGKNKPLETYKPKIESEKPVIKGIDNDTDLKSHFQFIDIDKVFAN